MPDTLPKTRFRIIASGVVLALSLTVAAFGQSEGPLGYSVPTPRPISPAEGTTTPNAQATQRQNPYLGSIPSKNTGSLIKLSLRDAIERGVRFNLGSFESAQASAEIRAERTRALSALLPQLKAEGTQSYQDVSYKELGIRLPPIPGLASFPSTSGGFGYADARVSLEQSVYDRPLRYQYLSHKSDEQASALSFQDSRELVAYVVGVAYSQAMATEARVVEAKAQLASAEELDKEIAHRVQNGVAPEIESLRAQVQRQSADQRVLNTNNQLIKDKLTLARVIGFSVDQQFDLVDSLDARPTPGWSSETAASEALKFRADLRSAQASVEAASLGVRAQRAQRLPSISLEANYGGAGSNIGNFNQVYAVSAGVSVPLYTSGRIRSEIQAAEANLQRRQAEYEDLKGRVEYDVKVAWLDLTSSNSSVKVAQRNQALAERALTQSQDRFANGVANFLEVVQAQEALAVANDNYIQSVFSYQVAEIALARATGNTEAKLNELFGGK